MAGELSSSRGTESLIGRPGSFIAKIHHQNQSDNSQIGHAARVMKDGLRFYLLFSLEVHCEQRRFNASVEPAIEKP